MEQEQKKEVIKKCPKCSEDVQSSAKKCKHCGADLRNWFMQHKVITGFLIFIVLGIIGGLGNGGSSNTNSQTKQVNNTASTSTKSTPKVGQSISTGQEGFLISRTLDEKGQPDDVLVAWDEKAYDEFTKSSVSGDTLGAAQIVLDGRASFIPYGTKALVIDQSFGTRKIRILEGEYLGQAGWVPKEFIVDSK